MSKVVFHDTATPHHRFRLCDPDEGKELPNAVEVHTVELTKYTLEEATISHASKIEQWAFLLFADQYESLRLRELLPAIEFQEAITIIELDELFQLPSEELIGLLSELQVRLRLRGD